MAHFSSIFFLQRKCWCEYMGRWPLGYKLFPCSFLKYSIIPKAKRLVKKFSSTPSGDIKAFINGLLNCSKALQFFKYCPDQAGYNTMSSNIYLNGSDSWTSSAAPRILPSFRAWVKAFSSTRPPRAVFTKKAPCLIWEETRRKKRPFHNLKIFRWVSHPTITALRSTSESLLKPFGIIKWRRWCL